MTPSGDLIEYVVSGPITRVVRFYGFTVPPVGTTVQLERRDYRVSALYWTIDTVEDRGPRQRVIVELEAQ